MDDRLVDQARALHRKLNNAAYDRLCFYSRLPFYDKRAETDPYVARIDRVLGRSARRILRRQEVGLDKPFDKEQIYDEQIAPLMAQIIAICTEHQIPTLASFAYRRDSHGEYDHCTTALPGPDNRWPESFASARRMIYTPGTEL